MRFSLLILRRGFSSIWREALFTHDVFLLFFPPLFAPRSNLVWLSKISAVLFRFTVGGGEEGVGEVVEEDAVAAEEDVAGVGGGHGGGRTSILK